MNRLTPTCAVSPVEVLVRRCRPSVRRHRKREGALLAAPDLWFNGRVWLWRQRVLALGRLPVEPGGWRTNPWQRGASESLPGLFGFAVLLIVVSRLLVWP